MRPRASTSIDWMTLSIFMGLTGIGWLMIFTVGHGQDGYSLDLSEFLQTPVGKQTIWIGISLGVFIMTLIIDWKFWRTFAYPIYIITMLGLGGVLIFGKTIKGATSWYQVAGFTLQPSELAKFGTCLALAAFLSTYSTNLKYLRSQLTAVALFVAPMGLILLQPDAGSALVFASFFILLYREGFSANFLIIAICCFTLLLLGLVNAPIHILLWLLLLGLGFLSLQLKKGALIGLGATVVLAGLTYYGLENDWKIQFFSGSLVALIVVAFLNWRQKKQRMVTLILTGLIIASGITYVANFSFNNLLKTHQQKRIKVWLKPSECDPQNEAYNLVHSKMAIGSGGFEGKGFLQGNLTQGNFVPEQITDFIFCTVGEEQGFIGSLGVIVLFLLLLLRIVGIAERQTNSFARHYAYGLAGILFIHFLINIGMTMGLMPIIGIPLPFISKGGSALLGFTIMIGVLLKMDANRYVG